MAVAEELAEQGKVKDFVPIFIEKDDEIFANLQEVIKAHKHSYPHVKEPYLIHGEFANVISGILQDVGTRLAPSFFFIDPFGFSGGPSGVPFSIVKEILSRPRTEIFFTFMVRDINRFLSNSNLWPTFDGLFGTDKWRTLLGELDRESSLRELYVDQLLQETDAKYVWDFRVCADKRIKTTYYLIHATKHFKGLDVMKSIMYKQGAGGTFAYLGPGDFAARHQLSLLQAGDILSFKTELLRRFSGRTLTYDQVREETWRFPFVNTDYNKALKEAEKEDKIRAERVSSRTEHGPE
jgi:three-Cys-motif partner protein